VWFGATILVTGLSVGLVLHLLRPGESYRQEWTKIQSLVSRQFGAVWDQPSDRRALAEAIADTFRHDVRLEDSEHRTLLEIGGPCRYAHLSVAVERGGTNLGYVKACGRRHAPPWLFFAGLLTAGTTLWIATGLLARRLVRPLERLTQVTQQIGAGNLKSRIRLQRHHRGEVGALAEAVNEMATRIERQLYQERQLLAAVSHEIRSPLARMRVLIELVRERPDAGRMDELERELCEIDDLVGRLLASSRLDFDAVDRRRLPAHAVAERALQRAGLAKSSLIDTSRGAQMNADATLLERALSNLIDNARRHAGGMTALRLSATERAVRFEVLDSGPGFSDELMKTAFDPFVRGEGVSEGHSLGLGLALVKRIARAHGGDASISNRAEGGALVSIELPRA
jgi:signal transduction histidine kinase